MKVSQHPRWWDEGVTPGHVRITLKLLCFLDTVTLSHLSRLKYYIYKGH
jgi:hypothetical protein